MRIHSIALVPTALALAAASLGCSAVCPPAGLATAPRSGDLAPASAAQARARTPAEARRVYRLDFVLASSEAGKPASNGTYSLNLEEDRGGEIRVGANVALNAQARQDVGFLIRSSFTPVGDDLLLHSNFEMSSADDPPTIRKLVSSGDALLAPGKAALVTSVEDPSAHRHYELTVTATRLR